MSVENLFLFFLACGAATFPLSLVLMRWFASFAPSTSLSRRIERSYEPALSLSLVIWIVGALAFYAVALRSAHQPADGRVPQRARRPGSSIADIDSWHR